MTVEHLSSETIVYDHRRHRVHCLNHVLTFIWKQCDGHTSVQEIAERLPESASLPPDQDVIWLALRQLNNVHLLSSELPVFGPKKLPLRREMVRKLVGIGTAAAVLPAVTSIVAPTPAMAASGDTHSGRGRGNENGQGDDQGGNQQH